MASASEQAGASSEPLQERAAGERLVEKKTKPASLRAVEQQALDPYANYQSQDAQARFHQLEQRLAQSGTMIAPLGERFIRADVLQTTWMRRSQGTISVYDLIRSEFSNVQIRPEVLNLLVYWLAGTIADGQTLTNRQHLTSQIFSRTRSAKEYWGIGDYHGSTDLSFVREDDIYHAFMKNALTVASGTPQRRLPSE